MLSSKEAGFSLSADDFKMTQSEIEDSDLQGAAGGELTTGAPVNGLQAWLFVAQVPEEAIVC